MKTLIIYDQTGKVWAQMMGEYALPEGLPYLEVEVPYGKYIVGVDISGAQPSVVYAEQQVNPMQAQVDNTTAIIDMILTDVIPSLMELVQTP